MPGGKWPVSTGGGTEPIWRPDGKELFYLAADRKLMAVEVKGGSTFEASAPRVLFETHVLERFGSNYAVMADGQRFLINSGVEEAASAPITVVVNWTAELRR
jgi:hypothetical protein